MSKFPLFEATSVDPKEMLEIQVHSSFVTWYFQAAASTFIDSTCANPTGLFIISIYFQNEDKTLEPNVSVIVIILLVSFIQMVYGCQYIEILL
jgi:hypothetical protein